MKKTELSVFAAIALAVLAFATPAGAAFGAKEFAFDFTEIAFDAEGLPRRSPATQAGSHPFAVESSFEVNRHEDEAGKIFVDGGDIKDLFIEGVRGLTGDTTAVPRCSTLDFATTTPDNFAACGNETVVGILAAVVEDPAESFPLLAPIYNLTPPSGVPVRLGFKTTGARIVVDVGIKHTPDYNAVVRFANIPQPLTVFGGAAEIWGVPADPAHDFLRGECGPKAFPDSSNLIVDGKLNYKKGFGPECPAGVTARPFLTLPRSCAGPLITTYAMDSWDNPGAWVRGADVTPPFTGCSKAKVPFDPEISSEATTDQAGSSSGQDFELEFVDEVDGKQGLTEPDGIAQSDMKKLVVTLPKGMTANPSLAEGLGVCTPGDLADETLAADPGEGCPNSSKIGTLEVESPLVAETVAGSVFLAEPDDPATAAKGAENPFDTLIALHVVIKNRNLGILVKQPVRVTPHPETGQLVTTADDVPQIPFTRLRFHFREGQRAPLITPSLCGTHRTVAKITPWARPGEAVTETASFRITRGVGGGPCPVGGVPPFAPGFEAGMLNNSAATYSPFLMRLTRGDGQQDMTKFSALFSPGLVGKIAGVARCSEAAIAAAKAKTGEQELAAPSCPASSRIGSTLGGAGVGSALTFVPGSLYLAGPYKGSLLSVVAVTPAVAGPFDVGTIVVRVGLNVNPRTAQVEVDGAASDPIPHILAGIPLNVRDLEVAADRPQFTLNPTSCDPAETKATLFGSFLDVFDPADDVPVSLSSRHQVADCWRLPYRPRLDLRLKGGTKRGGHPSLRAVFRPREGHANSEGLVFRFPRSAFLDQAHIRTICTRVQFAADACPKGAVYGHVVAHTPLLDEPLKGPVYLRSSDNELPDVVFDLHGLVDFEAVSRIDSVRGGIRATFTQLPDAPISRVVLRMQGGRKGLIVNSRDICATANRGHARLTAHSGKRTVLRPVLRARCGKSR